MNYLAFLELIQVVNNNYERLSQLDALTKLLQYVRPSVHLTSEQITELEKVAITTQNSHYDYKLFGPALYTNPLNHVDHVIHRVKAISKSEINLN